MRSFGAAASAWANAVLLLVIYAPLGLADVKFTEPSAGANLTAGQIDVRWEDSGISPPIAELTQYTLSLMVGGNDDGDMVRPHQTQRSKVEADSSHQQPISTLESQGAYSTGNTAQGTIQNGIAAEVPNGL